METIQEVPQAEEGPVINVSEDRLGPCRDKPAAPRGTGRPSRSSAGRPHSDMSPVVAVGGTLAVAGVALSAALLRLSGAHRKRVRSIKGQLQQRDEQVRDLTVQLADAQARISSMGAEASDQQTNLQQELAAAKEAMEERSKELQAAKEAFERRLAELEASKEQLASTLEGNGSEVAAARERCEAAEASRSEAEGRWREAYDELVRTKEALEEAKGELGLTRSQMISLERELQYTQGQLRTTQDKAEKDNIDYRASRMGASRSGDDTYAMWD